MASSSLIPKNGAVTFGSQVADFASFDITAGQSVEPVTPYGLNTCTKNVGSGTPDFSFNIGAFALKGASNTPLGMPAITATGSAMTLTLDTGVSEACTAVVQSIRIGHGRMRAAVPVAFSLKNYGDVTEVWAAS